MKTQKQIIERLTELVEREHTSGCDDNTCSINAAYYEGCYRWAIELYSTSGAASPEFDRLYSQLGKRFKRAARKEIDILFAVDTAECIHCNAMVYNPDDHAYHCGSCGVSDCRQAKVIQAEPGDRCGIGIHLLKPTKQELADAHERAIRDGFKLIYVHTDETWDTRSPGERRAQFKLIQGGAA